MMHAEVVMGTFAIRSVLPRGGVARGHGPVQESPPPPVNRMTEITTFQYTSEDAGGKNDKIISHKLNPSTTCDV